MPSPKDMKLYNKTKKKIYKKYPKHSAYRSGIVVKTYKQNFLKKYGKIISPYVGKKSFKKVTSKTVSCKIITPFSFAFSDKTRSNVYREIPNPPKGSFAEIMLLFVVDN